MGTHRPGCSLSKHAKIIDTLFYNLFILYDVDGDESNKSKYFEIKN